jgi:hypothetical protein
LSTAGLFARAVLGRLAEPIEKRTFAEQARKTFTGRTITSTVEVNSVILTGAVIGNL